MGGLRPIFCGGSGVPGSPSNTKSPRAEAYLHTKRNLDLCSHLAATDMGRKLDGCATLGEGELGPNLTQYGQGRGLPARQVLFSSVQPFGHNTPTLQTVQNRQTDNGPIA